MDVAFFLEPIVAGAVTLAAFYFCARLLPKAGKWGINTKVVCCPTCGTPPPKVRRPANRRQMLWGGNTCEDCGTEYDKYGTQVTDQ